MFLAASRSGEGGKEAVEVLTVPWAQPGEAVLVQGGGTFSKPDTIDVDTFFSVPLRSAGGFALAGEGRLVSAGRPIQLSSVVDGEIG